MTRPFEVPGGQDVHGSPSDLYQMSSRRLMKKSARGLTARTTAYHPQLRHLLVCPNQAGEVIGHTYHALSRYSFGRSSPAKREHLQTLNFIPNVLESGCGLLAAGGHTAELALRGSDPSSRWCVQTHVGKSINNSIHISPSPFHPLSTPRIHVSNNDRCVYRYELHFPKRWGTMEVQNEWGEAETDPTSNNSQPELEYIDRVKLDTPINHSSVSPDGRTMVAVGDTNSVFIFDINAHGQQTLIETIEASEDASFSTSWSRTGDAFAVASQDGIVTVFDRRYLTPLKTFETYQRGQNGAARVVKYSPGPHELLAFSEQKNYIHIVDARTYEFVERVYLPGVQLEDNARVGINFSEAALLNDLAQHPLLGGPGRLVRSLSPWDTMPADDATQLAQALDFWGDCPPIVPTANTVPSSVPSVGQTSAPRRSPTLIRPTPTTAAASSLTGASENSQRTVGMVLDGLDEPHIRVIGTETPYGGSTSTAITGLDWDPTGQHLYASMERIILEWQVDSTSRRCHPHASLL